jgi:tetratricopeptide (TPR) repeat protein
VVAPEPVAERAVEPPPEPIAAKAAPAPAPPAPKGPKALLAQAARLRDRGEVEKALDLYGQVFEADPQNVVALIGRGLCYLDLESYPPAAASFEAALGIRPDEPEALLGLAETYRWQGKKADAIRYYERYLVAHPDGEESAVARNALEELRK